MRALAIILGLWVAGGRAAAVELDLRVDDRAGRRVSTPYLTVQYASGATKYYAVTDDGSDPADAFPGDHHFVARVALEEVGKMRIWVTDGGPLASGIILHQQDLVAPTAGLLRVKVKVPGASSAGSPSSGAKTSPASGGAAAEQSTGVVADGQTAEAVEDTQELAPPSSGVPIRADALVTPVPFRVVRWPTSTKITAGLLLGALLLAVRALRGACRGLVAWLDALTMAIDGAWRPGGSRP